MLRALVMASLLWPSFAIAESKGPHHEGLWSSLNIGIRYSNVLAHRGVIFYDDFQIDPIFSLFFFDDRLEFVGDSLSYRDWIWGEALRARIRYASVTDNPLFPNRTEKRFSPDRPDSGEVQLRLEAFVPRYFAPWSAEVDLTYARDMVTHFGQYVDLLAKIELFEVREPLFQFLLEPNFVASVGWGDARHNAYLYGPDVSRDGFNNLSYGVWIQFPEDADRYYPIVQLMHFESLGDFARGSDAVHHNEGWLFSFIAAGGVLDWL